MGARDYLLNQRQAFINSSVIIGVALFTLSVFAVANAESTQSIQLAEGQQSSVSVEVPQILSNTGVIDASDGNTLERKSGSDLEASSVYTIKPIDPIKPVQPVSSSTNGEEVKDTSDQSPNSIQTESSTPENEARNDSRVRIRMRDRSSSELNGATIGSGSGSLNLDIKEETSTR